MLLEQIYIPSPLAAGASIITAETASGIRDTFTAANVFKLLVIELLHLEPLFFQRFPFFA